ncbi:MAG: wax ester/triacylglycerol synthase domain-containing protein [Candidatus Nanopelagicales bacterium]
MQEDSLERMGAFDAVMWGVDQDPVLRSVIVALMVLDREPDVEVLLDRLARMTLAVPRLRQRVVGNPVSPVPRWEPDPDFDMHNHLKLFHVPADGTFRPVLRIAEQMAEQDFERDRPLWEASLVQGFDGPRCAMIIKLHHAISDGVGGVAMAAALFDLTRRPASSEVPAPQAHAPEARSRSGRVLDGVHAAARSILDRGWALAGGVVDVSNRVLVHPGESAAAAAALAQSAARLLAPASDPLSPLMHGRSVTEQFEIVEVPLQPMKAAARSARATLSDVYLAAVAGGMAAYHEAHNAPARQIRVNMPVGVPSGRDDSPSIRWIPARFVLPIDTGDPLARTRRLSPILGQVRSEPALALSDSIYRLLSTLPRGVTTSISVGMMKGCDLAVTGFPGPSVPLFAAGAEVLAIVPFAPKAGAAVNVGMLTYHGTMFVGLNIDTRAVPDPAVLAAHVVGGFDQVLAMGDPAARARAGVRCCQPILPPEPPTGDPDADPTGRRS